MIALYFCKVPKIPFLGEKTANEEKTHKQISRGIVMGFVGRILLMCFSPCFIAILGPI